MRANFPEVAEVRLGQHWSNRGVWGLEAHLRPPADAISLTGTERWLAEAFRPQAD